MFSAAKRNTALMVWKSEATFCTFCLIDVQCSKEEYSFGGVEIGDYILYFLLAVLICLLLFMNQQK